MKTWSIWMEGYAATGNSAGASFVGESEGETFLEACINYYKINDPENKYYDPNRNTYWGCNHFDNQIDAIKTYG